jgi:hypothetical protein
MPAAHRPTCCSSPSTVLEEVLLEVGIGPSMPSGGGRPLAVGWATVELDRATRELGGVLGIDFVDAAPSVHLGAACRRSSTTVEGVDVVLLEPETEGRLAATLVRHDEGWAAVWLAADPGQPSRRPRVRLSAARPGPFGGERLVLGAAITGPHHLWVEAATIREP